MRVLLVVYDNLSRMHYFPIGLAYIAAVLIKEGYDVEIYNQDKFHYPDEHLTEYLDKNRFDVIGVGVIAGYYQYRKLLQISEAINRSKNRPFYIIGGHGPSPEPEYFVKKTSADAAIMGEGEETTVDLLKAIGSRRALSSVKGIAYRDGARVIINERRPLIEDIDSLPIPAYELFPIDYYRLKQSPHTTRTDFAMDMISSRGCTFRCTFCYRMYEGLRPRSAASIIDEVVLLKKKYGITYIAFRDELMMSSVARMEELCRDFIKARLDVRWNCNGRLNYAQPDILRLMKKAGCVRINYGIEAMDNQVLKNMKKGLTTEQVIKGVENTLKEGLSANLNIIFGNIGDNRETLDKGVEFLLKYDDGTRLRTIRPVTPYPGCPLYYHAIEKGLLKDCEDFYENKHINSDLLAVNFTDMDDDEFHKCLLEANVRLIDHYFKKKSAAALEDAKRLYLKKDVSFRGFRQT